MSSLIARLFRGRVPNGLFVKSNGRAINLGTQSQAEGRDGPFFSFFFFFTHFVCFATVSTPALIWAPPSRENNELNPQKKKSTHKTMRSLKSCAIFSKDLSVLAAVISILCVKPRQMGSSLLCTFLHKSHFCFTSITVH